MTTPDAFDRLPNRPASLNRKEWLLLHQVRSKNVTERSGLLDALCVRGLVLYKRATGWELTVKATTFLAQAPTADLYPILTAVHAGKTVLVVANENMLGYVSPNDRDRVSVLHASVLKGASPSAQQVIDCSTLRLATEQDFADYFYQSGGSWGDDYVYNQSAE